MSSSQLLTSTMRVISTSPIFQVRMDSMDIAPPSRSAAQAGGAIGAGAGLPRIMSDAFSAIATTLAFVFAPTTRG